MINEDIIIEHQKTILVFLLAILYVLNIFRGSKTLNRKFIITEGYYEISFLLILILGLAIYMPIKDYISNIILEVVIIAILVHFVSNLLHLDKKYLYVMSLIFISFAIILFFFTKSPQFSQDLVSIGFAFTLIAIFKELFYSKIFKNK